MKGTFVLLLAVAFAGGFLTARIDRQAAVAASMNPTAGYTIHIDAEQHFFGHPREIAHHWCKWVTEEFMQCLLYDRDAADARLVEVEMIVKPRFYDALSPQEQALWHSHKVEIPLVPATMPDESPAQAKAIGEVLRETYGKLYLLWDPLTSQNPLGEPTVLVPRQEKPSR